MKSLKKSRGLTFRGFTLIELLVVIAIIALLSSIILAALTTTRVKARNARIQEEVKQLQTNFELAKNSDGSYSNLTPSTACSPYSASIVASQTQALGIESDIALQNGGSVITTGQTPTPSTTGIVIFTPASSAGGCGSPTTVYSYAIYGEYAGSGTLGTSGYYCADSAGKFLSVTTAIPNNYVTQQQAANVGTCI